MRICQNDILEYIRSEHYVWLNFPDDLWPESSSEATPEGWHHSIQQFIHDREQLVNIIKDPKIDLFAPLPNSGTYRHTILREINIIASHNAYHTSEIVLLRKTLGIWPSKLSLNP
jgi:hypothetical protein